MPGHTPAEKRKKRRPRKKAPTLRQTAVERRVSKHRRKKGRK